MREDWQRIEQLFQLAIETPSSDRAALLARACGTDATLRKEVESLVAHHDRATTFIETPATVELDEEDSGPSLAGSTIGHYVIDREIGRGGMGVVYAADDTRLGRRVAIKVLAPRWTADARSRERLRREARVAATLSHPGIATVYALEEIDGHVLLVSELVAGTTLREELARGPLAAASVTSTALDLARVLAAAHAAGVVHRDLKPENVMRTAAGVKVLDFGLATVDSDDALPRLTGTGLLLGTLAYMAPEQLRGHRVDARADQFAFGMVICELAAGDRAFDAAALPEAIAPIVRRCLQTLPSDRFASTADLVAALDAAARTTSALDRGRPDAPVSSTSQARALWWWNVHQAIAAAWLSALLAALWMVRPWLPTRLDLALFGPSLALVFVSVTLRLHLLFTSRIYPEESDRQHRRARRWIGSADVVFAAMLLVAGAALLVAHAGTASFFIAAAVATALASTVIESATTRAAFRRP